MRTYEEGLSAVRYPRDDVSTRFTTRECPAFELGKARLLTTEFDDLDDNRPDVAVLAFGTPAIDALQAMDDLGGDFKVAVWDARFAKPVDRDVVESLLLRNIPIVTVEDHTVVGGFGSAVLECAQELGLSASGITRLGLPDEWIIQDGRKVQLAQAGIDAAGIARAIRSAAEKSTSAPGEQRADSIRSASSPASVES